MTLTSQKVKFLISSRVKKAQETACFSNSRQAKFIPVSSRAVSAGANLSPAWSRCWLNWIQQFQEGFVGSYPLPPNCYYFSTFWSNNNKIKTQCKEQMPNKGKLFHLIWMLMEMICMETSPSGRKGCLSWFV